VTAEIPTFSEFLDEARKLPDDRLQAHARVSSDNRHRCRECFTCACLSVVYERRKKQIETYRNHGGHLRTRPANPGKKGNVP